MKLNKAMWLTLRAFKKYLKVISHSKYYSICSNSSVFLNSKLAFFKTYLHNLMNNGNSVLVLEISTKIKDKEMEKVSSYLSLEMKVFSLTSIS